MTIIIVVLIVINILTVILHLQHEKEY